MDFTMSTNGEAITVHLSGHLDEDAAEALHDDLKGLPVSEIKELILDFKEVRRIGSAGIGQVLLTYKKMAELGIMMRLEQVSPNLYELFQGLKLDSLFPISKLE